MVLLLFGLDVVLLINAGTEVLEILLKLSLSLLRLSVSKLAFYRTAIVPVRA